MDPQEAEERLETRIIELREKGVTYKDIARRKRISVHKVRYIISEYRPDLEIDARSIRKHNE